MKILYYLIMWWYNSSYIMFKIFCGNLHEWSNKSKNNVITSSISEVLTLIMESLIILSNIENIILNLYNNNIIIAESYYVVNSKTY